GENERIQQLIAEVLKKQEEVTEARLEIARRRTLAAGKEAKASAPKELPAPPEIAMRQPVQSPAIPQSDLRLRPPVEPAKAPVLPPTPSVARPPVATPTPAAVPAVVKPNVVTAAAAGRILWVGTLPRDGTLTIDGKKASTGFLNGEFPGTPVTVGAF